MEKIETFEDLRIWQEARTLVKEVYKDFLNCRDFSFRDQIQSAAVSIMNNTAEGFERRSDADFARFLDIAKGSCGEVRSMYYTATDLEYVSSETAKERQERARNIASGIGSLLKHLRKKSAP
jgi:four helix bundle protein